MCGANRHNSESNNKRPEKIWSAHVHHSLFQWHGKILCSLKIPAPIPSPFGGLVHLASLCPLFYFFYVPLIFQAYYHETDQKSKTISNPMCTHHHRSSLPLFSMFVNLSPSPSLSNLNTQKFTMFSFSP
jgi:hypothetical protein